MNLSPLFPPTRTRYRNRPCARGSAVPTGYGELDTLLPAGGWPQAGLTEILVADRSIGALRLLTPALAHLSHDDRWICWVAPPHIPYSPALVAAGVELSRVLLIYPRARQDGLQAVERALSAGTCAAVLAWPTLDDAGVLRRLQLAAQTGNTPGFLFRPRGVAAKPSPAALRISLDTHVDGSLSVSVLKRRGERSAGPVCVETSLRQPPGQAAAGGYFSSNWQ